MHICDYGSQNKTLVDIPWTLSLLWFGFLDFGGGLFGFSVSLFGLGFGQGHLLLLI